MITKVNFTPNFKGTFVVLTANLDDEQKFKLTNNLGPNSNSGLKSGAYNPMPDSFTFSCDETQNTYNMQYLNKIENIKYIFTNEKIGTEDASKFARPLLKYLVNLKD